MRIIYEAEDGKQFYDLISAQKHEEKLDLTEIKGVEMYDVCGKKLEINSINFRQAGKIVINDINDLPGLKYLHLVHLIVGGPRVELKRKLPDW